MKKSSPLVTGCAAMILVSVLMCAGLFNSGAPEQQPEQDVTLDETPPGQPIGSQERAVQTPPPTSAQPSTDAVESPSDHSSLVVTVPSPPEVSKRSVVTYSYPLNSTLPIEQQIHRWKTNDGDEDEGIYLAPDTKSGTYKFVRLNGEEFSLRAAQLDHESATLFSKVFRAARKSKDHQQGVRDRLPEFEVKSETKTVSYSLDSKPPFVTSCYASRVLDGDTVIVQDEFGNEATIRLNGIDAPESEQPYGLDSTQKLKQLVTGRTLTVSITGADRYKRLLGQIWVDNTSVQHELVSNGLAWHYKKYNSEESLANAESNARKSNTGLWEDDSAISPWDWRNGARNVEEKPESIRTTDVTVYVTRTGSKYHRSGCRYLSKSKIPIPLSRARSAYSPCSRCNP